MNVKRLVELSGLKNDPEFREYDTAIPINEDGSYPYGGRAIHVYGKGIFGRNVSHRHLAEMAMTSRIERTDSEQEEIESLIKEPCPL